MEEPDPAEALLRAVERQRALSNAPETYTAVLYRIDILGQDPEEAAAALGL